VGVPGPISPGVFLSALALTVFAFGGILLGYFADEQKAGKRFFWSEAPLPEPELKDFLPKGVGIHKAA
jgi:hypothetical protein